MEKEYQNTTSGKGEGKIISPETGMVNRCSTMGWERRNYGLYYYRKKRYGKKVISEYIGTGQTAELIEELDKSERQEREITRLEWQEYQAEIKGVEAEVIQVDKTIQSLLRATLLASGHHPHKGEWRRMRDG
jgi:hypothetical protein